MLKLKDETWRLVYSIGERRDERDDLVPGRANFLATYFKERENKLQSQIKYEES